MYPQIERIFPEGMPKAVGPYSPATAHGGLVYVSGQIALNPVSNTIEETTIEGQTQQAMKNLACALAGSGCRFSTVLKTTILLTDMANFAKVNEVYETFFEDKKYPARMTYAVTGLPKGGLIQIDALAVRCIVEDSPKKKVKESAPSL